MAVAVAAYDSGRIDSVDQIVELLSDPDLTVRFRSTLTDNELPAEQREAINVALAVPAKVWTCENCGTKNDVEAQQCSGCQHGRPQSSHS